MARLVLVSVAALALAVPTAPAPCASPRCSCAVIGPRQQFELASAVFVGAAVRSRVIVVPFPGTPPPNQPPPVIRITEVVLAVERRWKGAPGDTAVVYTGVGGGDCGFPFAIGRRYLVYAQRGGSFTPRDSLETGICNRTRPLDAAAEDLAALGPPLGSP